MESRRNEPLNARITGFFMLDYRKNLPPPYDPRGRSLPAHKSECERFSACGYTRSIIRPSLNLNKKRPALDYIEAHVKIRL